MGIFGALKTRAKAILLWSQKYTRTDMLYVARGGFWLTLGQVATSILSLAVALAFANLLPKETYGTYRYVLSVVSILLIANLPQMGTAVTQAVARGYEGSLSAALGAKLRWGLLGSLAALGVGAYYYSQGNSQLGTAFVIAAALMIFSGSFGIYDHFLGGRKLFSVSVRYSTVVKAVSAASLILAALITKDLFVILLAYFVPPGAASLYFYLRAVKRFPPNRAADPQTVRYGKHLTVMGIISTIAGYLDQILVYHYLGAAQLAVYSIAIAPPNQLKALMGSLDALVLPKFAQHDEHAIRANMGRKFVTLALAGLVVIGAYILAAPFLFKILLPKYGESVFYSQLFSISLMNVALAPAVLFLMAKRKIKEQYYSNTISSVLQIALMALFTYEWGLLGLVIARVISRWAGDLLNLYFYRRTALDTSEASAPPDSIS